MCFSAHPSLISTFRLVWSEGKVDLRNSRLLSILSSLQNISSLFLESSVPNVELGHTRNPNDVHHDIEAEEFHPCRISCQIKIYRARSCNKCLMSERRFPACGDPPQIPMSDDARWPRGEPWIYSQGYFLSFYICIAFIWAKALSIPKYVIDTSETSSTTHDIHVQSDRTDTSSETCLHSTAQGNKGRRETSSMKPPTKTGILRPEQSKNINQDASSVLEKQPERTVNQMDKRTPLAEQNDTGKTDWHSQIHVWND